MSGTAMKMSIARHMRKPHFDRDIIFSMFLKLYMATTASSPSPTTKSCSLMISALVVSFWRASRGVDEDMARMESITRIRSIIQTTLSPWSPSMKFQNHPAFFVFFAIACSLPYYRFLTASLNFSPRSS